MQKVLKEEGHKPRRELSRQYVLLEEDFFDRSESALEKLQQLEEYYEELTKLISVPKALPIKVSKNIPKPLGDRRGVLSYREYKQIRTNIEENEELLASKLDDEFRELQQIRLNCARKEALEKIENIASSSRP